MSREHKMLKVNQFKYTAEPIMLIKDGRLSIPIKSELSPRE